MGVYDVPTFMFSFCFLSPYTRTMSLSALCCKRTHCEESILSRFPSGLLHPANSSHFCSPALSACDSVTILLAEGRSGWRSRSVSGSNGCLFQTVLSAPTHSNHLHYIHSGLRYRTNRCAPDSRGLRKCVGILGNQWHPGASEGISGFPRGEAAGDIGP